MKDHGELLAWLEKNRGIAYESPSRGAVCLARLRWGLPPSELIPGLDDAQRAQAAIQRTLRHPHRVQRWLDQYGDGAWLELERDVTTGGQRWTFRVTVQARKDGNVVIDDANVVRPDDGDDEADENDDEGEAKASAAEPLEPSGAPIGMVACPCCGRATLDARGMYQICPVCFWEDDGQDDADADVERGGPNRVSLTTGRRNYRAFGASVEADRDKVRPPTDEEVQVRAFAP